MTAASEEFRYCGATDLPLSAAGREALIALRAVCPNADGLRAVTSGMLRANETLKLLYGREPDRIEPDFAEIDFGAFELRSYAELKDDPAFIAWCADETGTIAPPNGESGEAFRTRVDAALDRIREDSLIVCHGGVIAEILCRLFPQEKKTRWEWQPKPGHGCVVEDGKYWYY